MQRYIVITLSLLLIGTIIVFPNRHKFNQAVAGASIFNAAMFAQATVQMPHLNDAVSYNIYYRQKGDQQFTNAVRGLPPSTIQYTITFLKKGVDYQYEMTALDKSGKEYWSSTLMPLANIEGM